MEKIVKTSSFSLLTLVAILLILTACSDGGERYAQEVWGDDVETEVVSAQVAASIWADGKITISYWEGDHPDENTEELVLGFGEEALRLTKCEHIGAAMVCSVVSVRGGHHANWLGRRVSVRYRR